MSPASGNKWNDLAAVAKAIVADGKGILAADESAGTAGKRLASIGLDNTVENRLKYRQMLFSQAPQLAKFIGGVILHEESVDQKVTTTGSSDLLQSPRLLTQPLIDAGIMLGIKLDRGTVPLSGGEPGETTTAGLDGLAERASHFYTLGCRFAKWRCTYRIAGDSCPSQLAIEENANVLAQYAAACHKGNLVPIVEPEILMDGDHSLEKAAAVAKRVLSAVVKRLHDYNVPLHCCLLKPSMVCPGQDYKWPSDDHMIAAATAVASATTSVLLATLPPALPGIAFLSGGLSEESATEYLNAINKAALAANAPWRITFSYARALQSSAIKAWAGKDENVESASNILLTRAEANSLASQGKYSNSSAGTSGNSDSLFVKDYSY